MTARKARGFDFHPSAHTMTSGRAQPYELKIAAIPVPCGRRRTVASRAARSR
jgi:hypothetical protein